MDEECPVCLSSEVVLTWRTQCCQRMFHYACFRKSLDSPTPCRGFGRCPVCRRQVFRASPHKVIPPPVQRPYATTIPDVILQPFFPDGQYYYSRISLPYVVNSRVGEMSRPLYELILKIEFMKTVPDFRFTLYPRQIFTSEIMRDEQLLFRNLEDATRLNSVARLERGADGRLPGRELMQGMKWNVSRLEGQNPVQIAYSNATMINVVAQMNGLALFACQCGLVTNSMRILDIHTNQNECLFGIAASCSFIPFLN